MEENNSCLINKHCVPCQGGVPPLTQEQIVPLLNELKNHWTINAAGHLYKHYSFNDFNSVLAFANQVGQIAEAEAHHPDILIAWGKCEIEIWTHKINGLTESDFILAAKIEALMNSNR